MLRAVAFGLAMGAAIQGFRVFPPDPPETHATVAVLFVLGILAAFFGGRSRQGAHAEATAVAVADARATASGNSVNLFVGSPGSAEAPVSAIRIPTESAPWLAGSSRVQLDSADVSDLLDGQDETDLEAHFRSSDD